MMAINDFIPQVREFRTEHQMMIEQLEEIRDRAVDTIRALKARPEITVEINTGNLEAK